MSENDKRQLNRYVTVGSETYGPGDELPAGVAEQIRNEKAWTPLDAPVQPAGQAARNRKAGTSSGARLAMPVTVGGVTYGPGDEIPDEVAEKITNPKVWLPDGDGEGDQAEDPDGDDEDGDGAATPRRPGRPRKAAPAKES